MEGTIWAFLPAVIAIILEKQIVEKIRKIFSR